jgi:hypothetical protein
MKKIFWILAAIWAAALLAACALPTNLPTDEEDTEKPGTPSFTPPLRAVAEASSAPGTPLVLDSYYDDTGNYYLIDVGNVRNTYLSTLFLKHYNGVTPVTASVTTVEESTVTQTVTTSVSKSITASATTGLKVEFAKSLKASIPNVELSASAKYEWSASLTASATGTESESALYSEVRRISNSETTSLTIGEHNEPAGHYRYALYAVCDVYFVVKTSRDNTRLMSLETVASARNETILPYFEYAADGVFDNSPLDGDAITFNDDFYRKLPLPSKTAAEPPAPPASPVETSSSVDVYDGDSKKISEDTGQVHTFNYPVKLDIEALKALGYTDIAITMDIEIRAQDTGDGRSIWLDVDNSRVWEKTNLNLTWTSWQHKIYTHTVDISRFTNASQIRFGFDTRDYFWTDAVWWFNSADVTFTAVK